MHVHFQHVKTTQHVLSCVKGAYQEIMTLALLDIDGSQAESTHAMLVQMCIQIFDVEMYQEFTT